MSFLSKTCLLFYSVLDLAGVFAGSLIVELDIAGVESLDQLIHPFKFSSLKCSEDRLFQLERVRERERDL